MEACTDEDRTSGLPIHSSGPGTGHGHGGLRSSAVPLELGAASAFLARSSRRGSARLMCSRRPRQDGKWGSGFACCLLTLTKLRLPFSLGGFSPSCLLAPVRQLKTFGLVVLWAVADSGTALAACGLAGNRLQIFPLRTPTHVCVRGCLVPTTIF